MNRPSWLPERPSWLVVALTAGGGFLVGVLLVIALGGSQPPPAKTITKVSHSITSGVNVYVRVRVPNLVGLSLTDARADLKATGFTADVSGQDFLDKLFGASDDGFRVSAQRPAAGTFVRRGAAVHLDVS